MKAAGIAAGMMLLCIEGQAPCERCRTGELPLRLRGGSEDPVRAARLAMAARAKERAKDAPPILREKELPPSASNPSAAMNVGKDEAQLMGMEGRAARLAAKTPTSKH
jgi:hypothetical protein